MSDLYTKLNPMLMGDDLTQALSVTPDYDASVRLLSPEHRLEKLNDILTFYYPFQFSSLLYTKLYLSLRHSLSKKAERIRVPKRYNNTFIKTDSIIPSNGILGGADCFTVIGNSGIGKSTAIVKALSLMGADHIFEDTDPDRLVIPALVVQCPWDASFKGMMFDIMTQIDQALHTSFMSRSIYEHSTIEMLIHRISTACINHIGLLVIDEIQNAAASKNGDSFVRALTQFLNSSLISICMVGTPECTEFFMSDTKLARRSLGISCENLTQDRIFSEFCSALWQYQYTTQYTPLTADILSALYKLSNGVTAGVVSLFYLAQQTAISSGFERLTVALLQQVYEQQMLFVELQTNQSTKRSNKTKEEPNNMSAEQWISQQKEHQALSRMAAHIKTRICV